MTDQVKLKDVTLMWAQLDEVDSMSGKYQVELTNLTQEQVEAISGLGLEVRTKADKPEKGFYITCKSVRPITAQDSTGGVLKQKVGNGSKANVLLSYYDWTFKNKKGRSPSVAKMIVTDLKAFGGGDEAEDDSDFL
jgi:hypothetical protein